MVNLLKQGLVLATKPMHRSIDSLQVLQAHRMRKFQGIDCILWARGEIAVTHTQAVSIQTTDTNLSF